MRDFYDMCRSLVTNFGAQIGIIAISVPALYIIFSNELENRWLMAALAALFLVFDTIGHYLIFGRRPRLIPVYLLVQTIILTALLLTPPYITIFLILFYILSVEAVMATSLRRAIGWMVVFLAVSALAVYVENGLENMLVSVPIYAGGYFFFASFGYATRQAHKAQVESERLLAELQEAHLQLQHSALQAEDLAVSEERNRLAREMHDTIGHRLTVSTVQLEGAQRLIAEEPERAARMVGTVREQVREALAELRQTVATLREPLEADLPLPQSLERLAKSFEAGTSVTVNLMLPNAMPELSNAHRLALFRAAQEGLTNIQRHARAECAWLQLTSTENGVLLRVSDNGVGLPATSEDDSIGLRGIRERAAQLGGSLLLEPRQGGGTLLSFALPVVE
jgi:signal transduction histidine kinase